MVANRSESMLSLEHEMGVVMRRLRRVTLTRAQMIHPDLNGVSYSVISNLADFGPRRATEIADEFAIDKGAVSRQVQQLVDLGLIDRSPDPDDGRASILTLSDKGRAQLEQVVEARRTWYDEQLEGWSSTEISRFATDLARYNAAIESASS